MEKTTVIMSKPASLADNFSLSEFPPVSYAQWREWVEQELAAKGEPPENFQKFTTPTDEGITLQPVYGIEDGEKQNPGWPGFYPFTRGNHADGYLEEPWEISQQLPYATAREFNASARHDLARGLTSLNLNLDSATRQGLDPDCAQPGEVGFGGVSIATLKALAVALEDIDLERVPVFVRSGASALPFAALFAALARQRGVSLRKIRGCIEMDPLGVLSHEGTLPQSMENAYREMAVLTKWAIKKAPRMETICVHGRPYHESGGNAVQELAFSLAVGVEYVREMLKRELTLEQIAPRIRFAFCLSSHFFMEIAKLRAGRQLWARVLTAFGASPNIGGMKVHGTTELWNKTKTDPHANILRATVEAFAGVLGGCESLKVSPFDEVFGQPDVFSRRIARNTQIILQSESNLRRLIDPAGGSWYVERLTDQVASEAWKLFQEIERRGGMLAALKEGFVQSEINRTAQAKETKIRTRKDVLVGTNRYPNIREERWADRVPDYTQIYQSRVQRVREFRTSHDNLTHSNVLSMLSTMLDLKGDELLEAAIQAVSVGATLGELTRVMRSRDAGERPRIEPLKPRRAGECFEELRAASDRWLKENKRRPAVFLANMGTLRQHKARADFSREFFEVGGFESIYPAGFENVDSAVQAALESGAGVAVLCSTDETYPDLVPAFVQKLKSQKPEMFVVLAGYPKEHVEAFRSAGVDEFIHIKADAYVVLSNLLKRLGVMG